MDDKQQDRNFEWLKRVVDKQLQVRRCKIEGMVMPMQDKLDAAHDLGLINIQQWGELTDRLNVTGDR